MDRRIVTVHQTLAPHRELKLLQGWHLPTWLGGSSHDDDKSEERKTTDLKKARLNPRGAEPDHRIVSEQDEFSIPDPSKDDKVANIDPLFGVDLDALTAGPGLINWAARWAVRGHRFNLFVFYDTPIRIYNALTHFVFSILFHQPPILMMVALLLRQWVGHRVLGARLPEPHLLLQDPKNQPQKDVLSMMRSFVTNMVSQSFPAIVTLYDVWKHLRTDMSVILCGLMVGLAWSHTDWSAGLSSPSDEL
jgi:hypothetical protein